MARYQKHSVNNAWDKNQDAVLTGGDLQPAKRSLTDEQLLKRYHRCRDYFLLWRYQPAGEEANAAAAELARRGIGQVSE